MRSGDDFTHTVRRGARVGTATVVVHGWRDEEASDGPLVGFVVAKSVGSAVTRNRVKRRLRHLVRDRLESAPSGARLVVRALPPAAARPARVPSDLDFAWAKLVRQWQPGYDNRAAAARSHGRTRS
ncbi:ribonuclease P protein component [Microlunatus soli]|uniref:Ribonuclease P protein component n=2 Tax=Microlunatus soli TaxID=630515 RepID=A0A1H1UKB8_9ACTN|nr:ribonuclease P protein component [Microlunatus soli]